MFQKPIDMVKRGIDEGVFPSAALAIGVKDKLLASGVWGSACIGNPSIAADSDTLYDIASLSKIVGTSMLAFKFIESGKLCLRDGINRFFDVPDDKQAITIRHLMTHTSGFADHFLLSSYISDPSEAGSVILSHPLAYETGTKTIYSCMGYILLGKILEKISGDTLDALAQKYVFKPLKMNNTTYHPSGNVARTEYDPETGEYIYAKVHDENARFLNGISGNAGVFSNIGDMVRFASMLASGGTLDGLIFLSAPMLRAAIRNYTIGFSQNRGLGFKLCGGESEFMGDLFSPESFGHTGFTGTSLAVDPTNGLYVVLLTNRVHPSRDNLEIIRFRNLLHNCIASEFSI